MARFLAPSSKRLPWWRIDRVFPRQWIALEVSEFNGEDIQSASLTAASRSKAKIERAVGLYREAHPDKAVVLFMTGPILTNVDIISPGPWLQ